MTLSKLDERKTGYFSLAWYCLPGGDQHKTDTQINPVSVP